MLATILDCSRAHGDQGRLIETADQPRVYSLVSLAPERQEEVSCQLSSALLGHNRCGDCDTTPHPKPDLSQDKSSDSAS